MSVIVTRSLLAHGRGVLRNSRSFFLHPDLREHPTGLNCVIPLMNLVTSLRPQGVKTLWV